MIILCFFIVLSLTPLVLIDPYIYVSYVQMHSMLNNTYVSFN